MSEKAITPHPHAVVLQAIAEGRRVQYNTNTGVNNGWIDMPEGTEYNPIFYSHWSWRVAEGGPAYIEIGGILVPEPESEVPQEGQEVFIVTFSGVESQDWQGGEAQLEAFVNCAVHLTQEKANIHLQALVRLNKQPALL